MMKAMGQGKRGPMAALGNMMGFGGGGGMPNPEQLKELAEKMPGGLPGGGLPKEFPGACRAADCPVSASRRCRASVVSRASARRSNRHCERSEAIQSHTERLDCFVASLLAMTLRIYRTQTN